MIRKCCGGLGCRGRSCEGVLGNVKDIKKGWRGGGLNAHSKMLRTPEWPLKCYVSNVVLHTNCRMCPKIYSARKKFPPSSSRTVHFFDRGLNTGMHVHIVLVHCTYGGIYDEGVFS